MSDDFDNASPQPGQHSDQGQGNTPRDAQGGGEGGNAGDSSGGRPRKRRRRRGRGGRGGDALSTSGPVPHDQNVHGNADSPALDGPDDVSHTDGSRHSDTGPADQFNTQGPTQGNDPNGPQDDRPRKRRRRRKRGNRSADGATMASQPGDADRDTPDADDANADANEVADASQEHRSDGDGNTRSNPAPRQPMRDRPRDAPRSGSGQAPPQNVGPRNDRPNFNSPRNGPPARSSRSAPRPQNANQNADDEGPDDDDGSDNNNAGGGGAKKRKTRTKNCVNCYTPCKVVHKVKLDHRRGWVFICDICWPAKCIGNPSYQYEATWVAGRLMRPGQEERMSRYRPHG